MSVAWQGVRLCAVCGDDIAETGKTLCVYCAGVQASLRLDVTKPEASKDEDSE